MSYKILAVTLEPISEQMAGPAIRCWELSQQLAIHFEVTVASPSGSKQHTESLQLRQLIGFTKKELYACAKSVDILFIQANVLKEYPLLAQLGKYIVVDLYDPYLFSLLAQYPKHPATASSSYRLMHHVLEQHMKVADFSICASEKQRDYWLGRYCSIGRLTPELYQIDSTFRKLIDIVPFGVPIKEPKLSLDSSYGIKDQIPGINKEDQVLLWGGGIWEWFDPITVIQAVDILKERFPRLRLLFLGWKSPNPDVPLMNMANTAKRLAKELGILDKHVFFHEKWIPYEHRINFLLDCDAAVSAHFNQVETHFSFRTRMLDYLWAGLPIITTGGDYISDMIQQNKCGQVVQYKDIDGWVKAIEQMILNPDQLKVYGQNSKIIAQEFTWNKVVIPLKKFCEAPYHLPKFKKVVKPSLMERAWAVYERGGIKLAIKRFKQLLG